MVDNLKLYEINESYIKSIQEKIWKNAQNVYKIKIKDGESSSLAKRCNDFLLLEKACKNYR